MAEIKRVLAVTGGLVVAGALFGAVAAVAGLAVLSIFYGDFPDALGLGAGALAGAALGAVSAPAAGWLLLRRVPLGKAIAWTTLSTVLGGVAGWGIQSVGRVTQNRIETALIGALAGFILAAVVLRVRAGRAAPAAAASSLDADD